jgi:dethiobiotin synthetase
MERAPRFVVVTGTDTGVGKTFVGVALARALVSSGQRTVAIKPVESGTGSIPPGGDDGALLAQATGQERPRAALVRLREPVAPAVAADGEGVAIDLVELGHTIRDHGRGADFVLIEGAGGLFSPLSWTEDLTHLARALDARVLVVGMDRLGVLNQVHLTIRALVHEKLTPLGVVLSAPPVPDASTGTNARALRRMLVRYGKVSERILELPRLPSGEAAKERLGPMIGWLADPS